MRKFASLIIVVLLSGLLLMTFLSLSTADYDLSEHYINHGAEETKALNLVTAILFDYRAFDTLGEATVVFAVASTIAFLVPKRTASMISARFSIIMQQTTSLLIPFLFMIGAYIIAYGHISPGGGFAGGVILAVITILITVTFGIRYSDRQVRPEIKSFMESFGAMGFVLLGFIGIVLGGNFLANANSTLDLGVKGELISSGIIPHINLMTGLKVAAGLSIMFNSLIKEE
ncbi:sodium:proton antiporter [Natroniella sulfidigena]|uniref:hydrogen gas-evolving membrane-bound hydrogenase subunit E n=1 Tax=Natroniella sulfidigena TaxID=723921 RepID=UPI00200A574E|nr:hydrogen gas-evolving membrane-bound hydrogenase subunit E [Natroniella sulfidigena]MCK8816056.1 sodium:proton antiporter [Natroniella sulfidigena]